MKTYTDNKIESVYDVAILLGLNPKNDFEIEIFKGALRSIAAAAIADLRNQVENIMHDEERRY